MTIKERVAKWMIRTGAKLLRRGHIVTTSGDIYIHAGSFAICAGTISVGGGGSGGGGGEIVFKTILEGHGGSGGIGQINAPRKDGYGPFCGHEGRQCLSASGPDACLKAWRCVGGTPGKP